MAMIIGRAFLKPLNFFPKRLLKRGNLSKKLGIVLDGIILLIIFYIEILTVVDVSFGRFDKVILISNFLL